MKSPCATFSKGSKVKEIIIQRQMTILLYTRMHKYILKIFLFSVNYLDPFFFVLLGLGLLEYFSAEGIFLVDL